ncbi:hypothetical protein M409DRAFT_15801 [Zasmidium cellare ATCC 36951]|uniref:F-box domain-containing protein n=1 Tax=Zasmidium cellare ATCC 36951 TaxID=1080233 RepID=A0A6A6D2B9_ZASCE|nr:uncharacterized protein M409DRAFT_15801 [Zasmidium cellare ATCC 36951]KAF2173521.1 hypothetical protein M409DRAFT_15801 [Zasmidium cellare ATCC 36951]
MTTSKFSEIGRHNVDLESQQPEVPTTPSHTAPIEPDQANQATTPKQTPSILSLNNDILLLLCSTLATPEVNPKQIRPNHPPPEPSPLKLFASSCHRIRALAAPLIYRNIKLGGYGSTWPGVHETLLRMKASAATLRHAKRFTLDFHTGAGTGFYGGGAEQVPPPSEELCGDLLAVLGGMAKLERLDLSGLSVPDAHLEVLKTVFEKRENVRFENVKTAAIPCSMPWVVAKCPNLSCLDVRAPNGTRDSPVEAIQQVFNQLEHLECKAQWTPQLLIEIHAAAPRLHTLAMQSSRPRYSRPIFDFIPTLAAFADLRCLALDHIGYLNVGYSAPRCGNAFRGPHGLQARQRLREDKERLSGLVAEAVFGKCKGLEELWIGPGGNDCRAMCVRDEVGAVKEIRWGTGQWEQPAGRV